MDSRPVTDALYSHILCDLAPYLPDSVLRSSDDSKPAASGLAESERVTIREFASVALLNSITKKFQDEVPNEGPDSVALDKFHSANEHCDTWSVPSCDGSYSSEYDLELFGEFKRVLDRALHTPCDSLRENYPAFDWDSPLDWTRISHFAVNGPHMALGASDCSFLDKFENSTITFSREFLWDLYCNRVRRSDLWTGVEERRESLFGHELVDAAKLTFVPKTVSESRCICIEPALNIFFQKGVEFLLLGILDRYFGINLAWQQSKNAELARLGSIDRSFGTIDLSSASDTISLKMIKDVLPNDVLSHLLVLRSPAVKSGSETIKLNMISTMGNAFTFPLQTIIFASAVEAVYNCRGVPLRRPRGPNKIGNYGVNGDDIVVTRDCYDDVVRLLKILGFIVNSEKSFNEGFFRESCGSDYFIGTEVRGVYCKTLRTKQDYYSLINRLNRWSARHGIVLTSTIAWLTKRAGKFVFVPPSESDSAGIHAPMIIARPTKLRKKNLDGKPFFEGHFSYQFYFFVSSGVDPVDDVRYTPNGVFLAAVKGECRGGRLVRRSDQGRYVLRYGSIPCWDWPGVGVLSTGELFDSWIRIVSIVYGERL